MQFRLTVIWHSRCQATVWMSIGCTSEGDFVFLRWIPRDSYSNVWSNHGWAYHSKQVKAIVKAVCKRPFKSFTLMFQVWPLDDSKICEWEIKTLSLQKWATVNGSNAPFPTIQPYYNGYDCGRTNLTFLSDSWHDLQSLLVLCWITDSFPNY